MLTSVPASLISIVLAREPKDQECKNYRHPKDGLEGDSWLPRAAAERPLTEPRVVWKTISAGTTVEQPELPDGLQGPLLLRVKEGGLVPGTMEIGTVRYELREVVHATEVLRQTL